MRYTIEQYKNLSKIENHKIIYDGFDYWWHSIKDKEFTLHCVKPFKDYKQILSYRQYWLPIYYERSIGVDCLDVMLQELFIDVKIKDIANNKDIKLVNKIKQILEINPSIKQKELVDLLEVTKMTISRYFKQLKAK